MSDIKSWYTLLSKRQKNGLLLSVVLIAILVCTGWVNEPSVEHSTKVQPDSSLTISDLSKALHVTKKAVARELNLPLDAPKDVPVAMLGVSKTQLEHSVEHIQSHVPSQFKYYLFLGVVVWALNVLLLTGRPKNSPLENRKDWYPPSLYMGTLVFSVLIIGFLLGKSPNPMEGVVKVFKSMAGLYPDPLVKLAACIFFLFLAWVGNKVICGWACPFGALQELIYSLPPLKSLKQKKVPFGLSNGIRIFLFLAMLLLLFGVAGGKKGFVLYHQLNPFNIFDFNLEGMVMKIAVLSYLLLSFVIYRPFCSFICPFGLVSWVVERASLYGVRVDAEKCTKCTACYKACPNNAIRDRVENAKMPSDCFSCARCLNACPVDAITYGKRLPDNHSHPQE